LIELSEAVNGADLMPVKGSGATSLISVGAFNVISVEVVSAPCAGTTIANARPQATAKRIASVLFFIFSPMY
jgi:hypothetical protein